MREARRRGTVLPMLLAGVSLQLLYAQAWKSVNGGQISTTRFSFWLSSFFFFLLLLSLRVSVLFLPL